MGERERKFGRKIDAGAVRIPPIRGKIAIWRSAA
jgi:hypothetical protein